MLRILSVITVVTLVIAGSLWISGVNNVDSSSVPSYKHESVDAKPGVKPDSQKDIIDHLASALDLLEIDPVDAGVTMEIGTLKFFIDSKENKVTVRIERVTAFRRMPTQVDTTELVDTLSFESIEDARQRLPDVLRLDTVGGIVRRLFFRKNEFAAIEFTADRRDSERFSGVKKNLGKADAELLEFLGRVSTEALSWGEGESIERSISLWFYPNDGFEAVYTTVTSVDGGYRVKLEDRVSWPWYESVETVSSGVEVKETIGSFMSRRHAFEFSSMRVYFAYEQFAE